MYTQFFGSYLLENGLINVEQLIEALQIQNQVRLKLGVLAINAGYMNALQVQEVHNQQARVDKRIGEIAVELGFLTEEQVNKLLGSQKSGYLLLGQALVDKEYITNEQFETAIKGFKEKYRVTNEIMDNPNEDDEIRVIDSYFKFDDEVDSEYKTYILVLFRNLVRFIGSDFAPISCNKVSRYVAVNLAYQVINGDVRLFTSIDAIDQPFAEFASRFACEKIDEVDDLAKDSVSEFLNLSNGLYTVNRSDAGIELKMLPQKVEETSSLANIEEGYSFELAYGFGTVRFLISR